MKKKKSNVNNITIISIIIVLLVLFLSIGWSSFNSSLHLDSMAMVRISSDIRVTGFNSTTSSNGGSSANDEYITNAVMGTISLPNSDSTVTYEIEITNMELAANTYMGIYSLTGLPSNLDILNITDYTLKSKICDDNDPTDCGSGAQKTFTITIGYKDNASYDANNITYAFNINVDFRKVFAVHYAGFTNPPQTPTTVMDGETPTINFNNDAQSVLNVISGGVTLVQDTNYTYSNYVLTFITAVTDDVYISNPATYNITYVLNGGTQANNQITTYTIGLTESILPPQTRQEAVFNGWYQTSDFTGDSVSDTSTLNGNVTLYAKWTYKVAMIGNVYYLTLQYAVNAATNNTNVTIDLVYNTSESVTIASNKIITLDLHDKILSNRGNNPVITNNGTLNLVRGQITTNGTQGAINNNLTFNMTGGSIVATGTKQAIYNAGTATISGDAYLSNTSSDRAAAQNLTGGTMIITGGTIESSRFSAVINAGTLRIGTEDNNVSTTNPVLRGSTYGVETTTSFDCFDGRLQGGTEAINDETLLDDIETGYELIHKVESVSNTNYKTVYLAQSPYRVIFNPGAGTVDETERFIEPGGTIGVLPTAIRTGYILDGWYDDDNDHHKVTSSEIINGNVTFYAHWADIPKVVRVGSTEYTEFLDGWTTIPDNTPTTVTLLGNVSLTQILTISNSKSIIFDLNGHTIDTTAGTIFDNSGTLEIRDSSSGGGLTGGKINNNKHIPVLVNQASSTITISGGTISSSVSQVVDNSGTMNITGGTITIGNVVNGILNNNANAILNMSGGTISAPVAGSKRQAIYNAGKVYISGTAVLTSASSDRATIHNYDSKGKVYISGGTISSTNVNCERGTIENASGAYVEITGGTITSKSIKSTSGAVQNAGNLVIGTKDGNINATSPVLMGDKYGVNNTSGTFKFYDGILKGLTAAKNGNITERETNSTIVDTTETIGGNNYYVMYLN